MLHEAAVHRVAGRYDAAVALYESLERTNPQETDPPYFLALIDLAQGRPLPAVTRLQPLVRRLPQQALVWLTYAHALRDLGRWRESVEASRRALALTPADVGERFALADALGVVGELDESLTVLRQMAEEGVQRLGALVKIAWAAPQAISAAEQGEMAAAAEQAGAQTASALHYALGPVLERQGRYDEAFAAFAEGARLKRRMLTGEDDAPERPAISEKVRALHPDEAARNGRKEVAYMKTLFTPEFIAAEQGRGSHLKTPIFIVGMPRSGSTLIEQILSSHPKVRGLGESLTLFETILGQYPMTLAAARGPEHFRQLAERYLAAMHDRGWINSQRLIDKMLGSYVFVGIIHLMFPRATILHAVRDPVDTCLSNFRTPFLSGNEESYDLAEIGQAYVRYREMMAHWAEVLPGRVVDVDHEALVADPETRIRWLVTQACGLDWNEACLDFHKTSRPVRTASVAQVRQPIFTTSVNRWRRYAKHLGPLFDALGPYAPPLSEREPTP